MVLQAKKAGVLNDEPRGAIVRTAFAAAALVCSYIVAWPASAHLSIDKLWVEFEEGDRERNDLIIRNDSEDRYYVSIAVSEVLQPGTENETRVTEADPERLGLLVTPNKLVLEPGAIRSIRLVSLNSGLTSDRVYRVLISPQVGAIKTASGVDEARGIAIKMLAAYDVLVVDRPTQRSSDIIAERDAGALTLRNQGNTNVLLAGGSVCPASVGNAPDEGRCRAIAARRLYAGNLTTVELGAATDKVFITTKSGPSAAEVEQVF